MGSNSKIRSNKRFLLTLSGFALLFGVISFVNHTQFRTYTLDLGLYTHGAYEYAHGRIATSMMFKGIQEPLLGGHFDLYLLLFSPLIYIFKTWTLLLVQWLFVCIGGIGIYRLFSLKFNQSAAFRALLMYFSFYGIYGAVSYDYHSVVISASMVPWLFLAFEKRKHLVFILIFCFILFGQENSSLWLFFLCSGASWAVRRQVKERNFLWLMSFIALAYFFTVLLVISPQLNAQGTYLGLKYSALGKSVPAILQKVVMYPMDTIELLFVDPSAGKHFQWIKIEFWIFFLLSGGILLWRKPVFAWMLLPILGQKLFHDSHQIWGIYAQYSIEFAPILCLLVFEVSRLFKNETQQKNFQIFFIVINVALTIRSMDQTTYYSDKNRIRFYQAGHYKRPEINREEFNIARGFIDPKAAISCQAAALPQLCCRQHIYQFPILGKAKYILLTPKDGPYPFKQEAYNRALEDLRNSKDFTLIYEGNTVLLFRKK